MISDYGLDSRSAPRSKDLWAFDNPITSENSRVQWYRTMDLKG